MHISLTFACIVSSCSCISSMFECPMHIITPGTLEHGMKTGKTIQVGQEDMLPGNIWHKHRQFPPAACNSPLEHWRTSSILMGYYMQQVETGGAYAKYESGATFTTSPFPWSKSVMLATREYPLGR